MNVPLFAMPPPSDVGLVLPLGFVLVLLIVDLFVDATARKSRGPKHEQNRRAGLGLMAILCGPLVGAFLAALADALGNVHLADVVYTYTLFIVFGSIAGFIAGVAFAVTCIFSPREAPAKPGPAKSSESWDDL
jgi:MFS family permease